MEPIDVIAQPPVVPPPNRPGRVTNQLQYIQDHVIDEVWNHTFSRLFRQPVDAKNLLVSLHARKQDWYSRMSSSAA